MKRRHKKAKRRPQTLQTWTLRQAEAAIPYIRSVLTSLREHHLEMQSRHLEVKRRAVSQSRPDRAALIEQSHAIGEADRAADRAAEAAAELAALDVFCLDPVAGQALLPFLHDEQLAWYLFDLFDEQKPLRYWRFDGDPTETRRPITPLQKGEAVTISLG